MSKQNTQESNQAESRSGVIFFCNLNKRHFLTKPKKGVRNYIDKYRNAHINVFHARFQMAL